MFSSNNFTYRVNVKKANNWKRYNRARLGISVGKPNHEGEKFFKTLEWVNARFRDIEVRVSDTLQRFNFPGDPASNIAACHMAGTDWIERNKTVLKKYPNILLYRWDDLLNDPDLPRHRNILAQKMAEPDFRDVFEADVQEHAFRTKKDPDRCQAFMLEEFAIFHMQQEKRPASDIYPGSFFACHELLRDDFALTRIDFDRVPLPAVAA